ncbi:peptide-methionine (S)-S-oxide reductase MsrA [Pseudoroseicyclus aestuarii]|uniref:Peptide methionine sulfoxide reductase MsrA n=1 Tax=Pseudoroseicyclus aestuarii TaxID=1795041 RepID=A0A318SRZ9_9RHOB|nr:peptide-methionine (S)-S-oxide reductase MsrA [Pseudoroseicyclus aestuarii]PYE84473.1 peptide-methionine (S)-S-oxide reductase [Pseudoroseicyclus aestuarii]
MHRTLIATLVASAALAGPALAQEEATAIVAGGCFWCVEADFESVEGVSEVVSGYAGGTAPNPTYDEVASGRTDYYEAAEIHYDPSVVSYEELMHLFFRSVDPLDVGGQFCDRGDQYRTAIFATPAQEEAALAAKAEAEAELGQEVATPVLPAGPFYEAEDYHQDYYLAEDRLPATSVGLFVPKNVAYTRYREGCGRDARVEAVWGPDAPFLHKDDS